MKKWRKWGGPNEEGEEGGDLEGDACLGPTTVVTSEMRPLGLK